MTRLVTLRFRDNSIPGLTMAVSAPEYPLYHDDYILIHDDIDQEWRFERGSILYVLMSTVTDEEWAELQAQSAAKAS